jgi:hypothetical protein
MPREPVRAPARRGDLDSCDRERDVLHLLALGYTNREIGSKLAGHGEKRLRWARRRLTREAAMTQQTVTGERT